MEDGTKRIPPRCDVMDTDTDPFQWDTREACEVRKVLDRVADKWSLLVIALLDDRSLRFSELRRLIDGISQRVLTATLRQLERDGVVRRTITPLVPPRVDYALTPLGESLHDAMQIFVSWTESHQDEIASAREACDERVTRELVPGRG